MSEKENRKENENDRIGRERSQTKLQPNDIIAISVKSLQDWRVGGRE